MPEHKKLLFHVVVGVDPKKADFDSVRTNMCHRLRTPFVEGAWAIGSLDSLDVLDYQDWHKAEADSARQERTRADQSGYERAKHTLVEPAHAELDNLEPKPPRYRVPGNEARKLTPAARIEWYRHYLNGGIAGANEMMGVVRF